MFCTLIEYFLLNYDLLVAEQRKTKKKTDTKFCHLLHPMVCEIDITKNNTIRLKYEYHRKS